MTETTSGSVRHAQRVLLALTIAIPSAYLAWFCGARRGSPSDFGLVWAAARFLKAGTNPYAAIGPDGLFQFQFHLNYPLPAAVAMLPSSRARS